MIRTIQHVGLAMPDPEQAATFYRKEQGLFRGTVDGPPPPDFPRNLIGAR